jgi:hypothetical protein
MIPPFVKETRYLFLFYSYLKPLILENSITLSSVLLKDLVTESVIACFLTL